VFHTVFLYRFRLFPFQAGALKLGPAKRFRNKQCNALDTSRLLNGMTNCRRPSNSISSYPPYGAGYVDAGKAVQKNSTKYWILLASSHVVAITRAFVSYCRCYRIYLLIFGLMVRMSASLILCYVCPQVIGLKRFPVPLVPCRLY